jgi:hypothetical protein
VATYQPIVVDTRRNCGRCLAQGDVKLSFSSSQHCSALIPPLPSLSLTSVKTVPAVDEAVQPRPFSWHRCTTASLALRDHPDELERYVE